MQRRRGWLAGYEPQSLGDFELTPQLDHELSIRALAARTSQPLRQSLYIALAIKIARFSNPYLRWRDAPWEYDEVLQETWIAFDDVLRAWQPLGGNGPPAGFGYYFLAAFRFRLRDRLNALGGLRRTQCASTTPGDDCDVAAPDDTAEEATVQALLEQICGQLNAVDASLLRHRASGREFEPAQLRDSGITLSRRTAYRRWPRIVRVANDVIVGRTTN